MPITFRCSTCARPFSVPETSAGKTANCPGCGTLLTVPAESTDLGPVAPAAVNTRAAVRGSDKWAAAVAAAEAQAAEDEADAIRAEVARAAVAREVAAAAPPVPVLAAKAPAAPPVAAKFQAALEWQDKRAAAADRRAGRGHFGRLPGPVWAGIGLVTTGVIAATGGWFGNLVAVIPPGLFLITVGIGFGAYGLFADS